MIKIFAFPLEISELVCYNCVTKRLKGDQDEFV